MTLMPPPSPRHASKQKKRWCTTGESPDQNDLKLSLTPRHVDITKSPDRPPMRVVIIQSTSTDDSQWVELTNEDHSNRVACTPPFGSSPWSNVTKLMPRRPLPVSCVSPTPSSERKRRASAIASSSMEDSTFYSPRRPSGKLAPKKKAHQDKRSFIHRKTPSEESLSHNVMEHTPRKMAVDFALENLSLQSPVARKAHHSTRSPSSACRRERGNPFSDYIASPARSLHSSFSDYVPSPALRRPRSRTSDSCSQGSLTKSPLSPRKVRLKVISKDVSPRKQLLDSLPLATPEPRKLSSTHHAGTALLYSHDEDDDSSAELGKGIMPSSLSRLPPLARRNNALICNGDITITPRTTDQQPSPFYTAPHKPSPTISFLSPRTPLPKISLTPRKPRGKVETGLMPRLPLARGGLSTPPTSTAVPDCGLDAPASFGETTRTPQDMDCDKTPSKSTYPISPRLLFPPGSCLLSERRSAGGVDTLLNKSIETSTVESLASNLSYSDDEEGFVLATPAVLKKEAALRRSESNQVVKIARRDEPFSPL